jgi:cell division protein FtsW (lipid II flippase)
VVGYATQVSWVLIAAIGLSLLYELYRATAKAGTSKYDSMRTFLTQAVPSCAVAFALAVLVRTGWRWVAWTALALAVALIVVSIFYAQHDPSRGPEPAR